jgi:REP element-mobilizing transposase RayT
MVRGIERRRIFLGEEDRRDFVARLERVLPEEGWRSFAWALMPNHVHLVLQGSAGGLSRLMARLNTGYAKGFNRRHRRSGYLFQNRFKSRAIEDDADLMNLVIYAHRNPLVAGIVASAAELERFPWCGHGALVGSAPPRGFEAVRACLSLFADDPVVARSRVRAQTEGPEPESNLEAIASVETAQGAGARYRPVRSRSTWPSMNSAFRVEPSQPRSISLPQQSARLVAEADLKHSKPADLHCSLPSARTRPRTEHLRTSPADEH